MPTTPVVNRNALGSRTAWLSPLQNTLARVGSMATHFALRVYIKSILWPGWIFPETQTLLKEGLGPVARLPPSCPVYPLSIMSLYIRLSIRASHEASMMLVETPMVPQRAWPSVDSISTRTLAAVPAVPSSTRTL